MKKILILELTNPEQLFGANATAYAMFSASCEGQNIEIGITHNSLRRKGVDTSASELTRLVGCTLTTKDYVDTRTGAITNGDERVQMLLDGEGRLVLFNSINHSLEFSDVYKHESREITSATNAKLKMEKERELFIAKKQALFARLASRTASADASVAVPTENQLEQAEAEQPEDVELGF